MMTSKLPVALPAHWFTKDDWRGTLIRAVDGKGHVLASVTVTVNEDMRGYLLGVQPVPAFHGRTQRYMRRGWRLRLFRYALAALMLAWRSVQPVGQGHAALHDGQRQAESTASQ